MHTEPNVKQAVPFFWVADMDTSLHFYTNRLGFELIKKWEPNGRIAWCWLQLGSASLMLQEHMKTAFQESKKGTGVSVCFICKDALALYHAFRSKEIEVNEPFVGNGAWVIMVTDPDGFSLLFESETDVPEETKYTDWV
ncbi:VOC family protein [Chitinophaga sp. SYP-B3965]|uniref:VOC family protein n=1 Tax=Chitinophaga sp. SYP-B3965 TaxID=2663120 RepID=UPI001299DF95|nr:VOC family protein [Chitinophaga sp. SYP-B3965]MRG43923.1 VOC family protein [Chitinophaga sp. SYP-B3965]